MWDFVMDKSDAGAGFLRELRFPLPIYIPSACFSTIIFTITRGWHNRPGVAALPIASQFKLKKKREREPEDRSKTPVYPKPVRHPEPVPSITNL
jgi:hypothetical protein